jgi:alkylation response protein AidB-like acyl-CoA dehydrogenase
MNRNADARAEPNADATRVTLLDAAAGIRETLARQWREEEAAATLSAASVEALAEAGILAMKLPAVLGGHEADPVTQLLVLEALAEANPSASWCAMVGATGIGLPGAFLADRAVAEMFGGPRLPRGAIIAMPAGRVVPEPGGWRLSGRWPFASGVRHADWITAGALIPLEAGQPPVHCMLTFPAARALIHDNWRVAGLKGTGSCDVSVRDLFVPEAFAWDFRHAAPRRGGPLYRIGHPGFVANEHAGFALGTARRAIAAFVESAARKTRGMTPAPSSLAARPAVQRLLGEAELKLGAARALAIAINDAAWVAVSAGAPIPDRLQAELRAAATYCTEVAVEVVTQTFRFAGGGAIYEANLLQQCLRDINVAAQHIMVSEIAYENLGQFILELPGASSLR